MGLHRLHASNIFSHSSLTSALISEQCACLQAQERAQQRPQQYTVEEPPSPRVQAPLQQAAPPQQRAQQHLRMGCLVEVVLVIPVQMPHALPNAQSDANGCAWQLLGMLQSFGIVFRHLGCRQKKL